MPCIYKSSRNTPKCGRVNAKKNAKKVVVNCLQLMLNLLCNNDKLAEIHFHKNVIHLSFVE